MIITSTVTGDDRVQARLLAMPGAVRSKLQEAILRSVIDLESYVRKEKLSGQLLKRRTGTLAASIQHKMVVTPDDITGIVGSRVNESAPLKYAAIHEYGFSGQESVREYMRKGHPVRAHIRNIVVPAKRYLRGSLDERAPQYVKWMQEATKV